MNLFPFVPFSFSRDRTGKDLLLNLALKRQSKMERDRNGVRTDGNMTNMDETRTRIHTGDRKQREREREECKKKIKVLLERWKQNGH